MIPGYFGAYLLPRPFCREKAAMNLLFCQEIPLSELEKIEDTAKADRFLSVLWSVI